jgi:membrane protein YqaA with SNARE-associated domain
VWEEKEFERKMVGFIFISLLISALPPFPILLSLISLISSLPFLSLSLALNATPPLRPP